MIRYYDFFPNWDFGWQNGLFNRFAWSANLAVRERPETERISPLPSTWTGRNLCSSLGDKKKRGESKFCSAQQRKTHELLWGEGGGGKILVYYFHISAFLPKSQVRNLDPFGLSEFFFYRPSGVYYLAGFSSSGAAYDRFDRWGRAGVVFVIKKLMRLPNLTTGCKLDWGRKCALWSFYQINER